MPEPFVGATTYATDGTCAYAADLDTQSCGQPATVHIIGRSTAWGWVGLASCDTHQRIAMASLAEISEAHMAAGCNGEHYEPVGETGARP